MVGTTAAMLNILGSALSIWDNKEKTKYQDKMIKLQKEWYEEFNRPIWKPGEELEGKRRDAVLDDISLQLRILCNNVSSAIGAKNTSTK